MASARAARLAVAAAVLVTVLGAGSARLVSEGRAALSASDAAREKGDVIGAAVHARSAARAYVPGAAHMQLGYDRLRQIAESSERSGDVEGALFAWRAISSASDSTRPFSAASDELRAAAQASVARLSASVTAATRAPSLGRRAPRADPSLVAEGGSRVGWGALLLGGAALWCAAGARLAARGFAKDGRLVRTEIRAAAVMALVGLAAWVAGLLFG